MSSSPAVSPPSDATTAYLRRARRLRHVYGHRPEKLQRSLRDLSRGRDAEKNVERISYHLPTTMPGRAQAFADFVAKYLEGATLRYSRRMALLRDADRRGIERFEANLIIAAVQHRATGTLAAESKSSRRSFPTTLAAFVILQSIIVVSGYLLLA